MVSTQDVLDTARRAREASHGLALATRAQKDAALLAMADALLARWSEVLDANAEDVGPRGGGRRRRPTSSTGSG